MASVSQVFLSLSAPRFSGAPSYPQPFTTMAASLSSGTGLLPINLGRMGFMKAWETPKVYFSKGNSSLQRLTDTARMRIRGWF